MPRLILVAGFALFILRISYDKSIEMGLVIYPFSFGCCYEAVVYCVEVERKSGLMFTISRTGRKFISFFLGMFEAVVLV